MEFYQVINGRRTIRDFQDKEVPQEALERILDAGLKGPSGDHLRDIHYVVYRDKAKIKEITQLVQVPPPEAIKGFLSQPLSQSQKDMYQDALPRQETMLSSSGTLVLPFFRFDGDFNKSSGVSTYNNFVSTWCGIENIMLAATAEGLKCAFHIPTGNEPAQISRAAGAPQGYVLCCCLAIGYPAKDAKINSQTPATVKTNVHWNHW
jgi:nitroreductase